MPKINQLQLHIDLTNKHIQNIENEYINKQGVDKQKVNQTIHFYKKLIFNALIKQKTTFIAKNLFTFDWDIRKSAGGYSIDKKDFGSWVFYHKTSSLKEAVQFVLDKLLLDFKN